MEMTNELKNDKAKVSSPSFVEITPLRAPHVYAAISNDPQNMTLKYVVMEPTLTEEEKKALGAIKKILFQILDVDMRSLGSTNDAERWLGDRIARIIKDYKINVEEGAVDMKPSQIVVGVVLDTMKQLEAQLVMRRYEGFIK
jgi:hypothetical protein